jgi:hypothetical protein
VESHRARIKEKLQTKTISELIAHAAGWVARQSMADQSGYAMVH